MNANLPLVDNFYLDLGERIKTERLKLKYSQEQLADVLDLTRASIINLEKGRHRPSIYQLLTIAYFFEIDYTELIPIDLDNNNVSRKRRPPVQAMISEGAIDKSSRNAIQNFLTAIKHNPE